MKTLPVRNFPNFDEYLVSEYHKEHWDKSWKYHFPGIDDWIVENFDNIRWRSNDIYLDNRELVIDFEDDEHLIMFMLEWK